MTFKGLPEWFVGVASELSRAGRGQLSFEQYCLVGRSVLVASPPRVVVFGCGDDSDAWWRLGGAGVVFVEDKLQWAGVCVKRSGAAVVLVKYRTRVCRAGTYSEADLRLPGLGFLPDRWFGVVMVDGPVGCSPESPGRMSSIVEASRLVAAGGVVWVHDMDREIERVYSAGWLVDGRGAVESRFGNMSRFDVPGEVGAREVGA